MMWLKWMNHSRFNPEEDWNDVLIVDERSVDLVVRIGVVLIKHIPPDMNYDENCRLGKKCEGVWDGMFFRI